MGALFDGLASTAPVVNGASIRLVADDSEIRQSRLIDSTPTTTSCRRPDRQRTFTDPLSGVAITTAGLRYRYGGAYRGQGKGPLPGHGAPGGTHRLHRDVLEDGLTATPAVATGHERGRRGQVRIFRDDVLVATVAGSATSWSDPDRVPGATYSYRIKAIDWSTWLALGHDRGADVRPEAGNHDRLVRRSGRWHGAGHGQ